MVFTEIGIQHSTMSVVSLTSCIIIFIRHELFVEACNILININRKLKNLSIEIDDKIVFITSIFCTSFVWCPFVASFQSNRTMLIKILDILAYGYPIIIRFCVIGFYSITVLLAARRFIILNQFLCSKNASLMNEKVLYTIMEIYEKLIQCVNLLTKFCQEIMLLNIFGTYIQFVFGLYYIIVGTSGELSMFENHLTTLALNFEMIGVYLLCFYIKKMVSTFILLILLLLMRVKRICFYLNKYYNS